MEPIWVPLDYKYIKTLTFWVNESQQVGPPLTTCLGGGVDFPTFDAESKYA